MSQQQEPSKRESEEPWLRLILWHAFPYICLSLSLASLFFIQIQSLWLGMAACGALLCSFFSFPLAIVGWFIYFFPCVLIPFSNQGYTTIAALFGSHLFFSCWMTSLARKESKELKQRQQDREEEEEEEKRRLEQERKELHFLHLEEKRKSEGQLLQLRCEKQEQDKQLSSCEKQLLTLRQEIETSTQENVQLKLQSQEQGQQWIKERSSHALEREQLQQKFSETEALYLQARAQLETQEQQLQHLLEDVQAFSSIQKNQQQWEARYHQLYKQFQEKSGILNQTRKELFLAENTLLSLQKEKEQQHFEEKKEHTFFVRDLKKLEEECEDLEEQATTYQQILSALILSNKKRKRTKAASKKENDAVLSLDLETVITEKIDSSAQAVMNLEE